MLSPHFLHAGMGLSQLFYLCGIACCLIITVCRVSRKKRSSDNSNTPTKHTRIFVPILVISYSLACFLLLMWIFNYSTNDTGFDTLQPILAAERTALLIFNTAGIAITLLFYASLVFGLQSKKLRCRFKGWLTLTTLALLPIIYGSVQRSDFLHFKLVDPEVMFQDWPEANTYQILFIQDDLIWNMPLNGTPELKLEPAWPFSQWTRIEFSIFDIKDGFASVISTSLRDSNTIINLPLKIKANHIGLFVSPKQKFQDPRFYTAKISSSLNSELFHGLGGGLRYEQTNGIYKTARTYNAAHLRTQLPSRDRYISRMAIDYCTRLDDTHFLFALGSREIYLLDVSSNQIAKLTNGYSPLVYTVAK